MGVPSICVEEKQAHLRLHRNCSDAHHHQLHVKISRPVFVGKYDAPLRHSITYSITIRIRLGACGARPPFLTLLVACMRGALQHHQLFGS